MPPADARNHDPQNRPLEPRAALPTQRPATMPATAVVLSPAKPSPALPPALPPVLPAALPTPIRLVRGVRRRLLRALCWGLAVGWVAAVAAWLLPGLYRGGSYSVVRVAAIPPHLVYGGGDAADFEKCRQTEAGLVKQHAVLEAALRDPDAAAACPGGDAAEKLRWLQGALTAEFTDGPELLRIGLQGERPEATAPVVAAVTRAYLDESARLERQERAARLEKVTAAAARSEDELRQKRQALLRRTGGADDGSRAALRQHLAAERLAQAERDLFQVRAQATAMQAEVEARRRPEAEAAVAVPESAVAERLESYLQQDVLYQTELTRQAALQAQIDQVRKVAANPESQTQPARLQLEASRAAAQTRRGQLWGVAVNVLRDRALQDYRAATAQRTEQLAVLRSQDKQLAARVKELGEEARPNAPADDLARAEADVVGAEDTVKRLREQVEVLRLEQDAPPRVTALADPVVVPPDMRRQARLAGLAGVGGFALGLLSVGWWDFRTRRVETAEDVTQWLGLRLLGAVPALPANVCRQLGDPAGGRDARGYAQLKEAVDVTRTLLLNDPVDDALQVVLVTSAVEGEGKTTLASQLAASLARAGHKTLLVDADLRRPSAHRLFDLPAEPGLAELLRGEAAVSDAVHPTRVSRLWLVPAGACDVHTPQALGQEGTAQLFEELRGQFDYVVLDASPVLPVADALLLARHADGAVLSVLREASRLPRLHAACQRLAMLGVRVLGAVVSGARGDVYAAEYHDLTQVAR